jgi:hypothetical protein
MSQLYALVSVVFMMGFVVVFDWVHQGRRDSYFCTNSLLGAGDVDRIRQILDACQET